MKPKTAQLVFVFLNILAVFAVGYLVYDICRVEQALQQQQPVIAYDSGVSAVLLMSIFWLLSLVQYTGLKHKTSIIYRHAGLLLMGWFIGSVIIAYLIPFAQKNRFEYAGYFPCSNPASISRVARGSSLIYVRLEQAYLTDLSKSQKSQLTCSFLAKGAENAK
ncbi:hypothetical protein [Alkalimonas amylolytica]|uniref:DUF1240 domain-containing protein n=1 Tax=Alkalimonas amylolytica TaxID=152573 RepID=A0A1H4E5I0_ALKAM|nr:hypothetical protein [Alkalimonas amylolytica]SEA80273.1 hypothetical protein SAMN04488051_106229 [Alkalimonas amylolytica]